MPIQQPNTPTTIRSLQIQEGDPIALNNFASQASQGLAKTVNKFDSSKFNFALLKLLRQYQQLGTLPYEERINAIEQKGAERLSAEATPGMSPQQQSAIRSADINALQPSLSGTQRRMKTHQEEITGLGNVLETTRKMGQDIQLAQEKATQSARDEIWNRITTLGSRAFKGLSPEMLGELEGQASWPKGFLSGIEKTIKERELENKKPVTPETKVIGKNILERDPATGVWKQVYSGGEGTGITEAQKVENAGTIGTITSMLNDPTLKDISGRSRYGYSARTGATKNVRGQMIQLKALTSLNARAKLKGSGTISDFEAKMLGDSANILNSAIEDDGRVNMPDDVVKQNLLDMRGTLLLKSGEKVRALITDPGTNESFIRAIDSKEAQSLYLDGNIINFLE